MDLTTSHPSGISEKRERERERERKRVEGVRKKRVRDRGKRERERVVGRQINKIIKKGMQSTDIKNTHVLPLLMSMEWQSWTDSCTTHQKVKYQVYSLVALVDNLYLTSTHT